jgi:hypothetical protein
VLYVAPEGFIVRRGGPNGLRVTASATAKGSNGHDAAVSVHADQDVLGTPVRQIMRGLAPWMFRHDSPHGANQRSPLCLLNLWIPLHQPTRPLVLMDRRSLDRSAHQLRYALPTGRFLDRPADRAVNDIWAFTHDAQQRWVFRSETGPHDAWVFDTFSTPHGAVSLPGEEVAEALYLTLREAIDAADEAGLRSALSRPIPQRASQTRPLSSTIAALQDCRAEALADPSAVVSGPGRGPWIERVSKATKGAVRVSVEMRTVCWIRRDGSGIHR